MKLNLRQRTTSKTGPNKVAKILPSVDTPPPPLFPDLGFTIATGINSTITDSFDTARIVIMFNLNSFLTTAKVIDCK